jgi:NAD(P)-dependent dehydrogenase (short-subunit alcohol dehydrogenase family)
MEDPTPKDEPSGEPSDEELEVTLRVLVALQEQPALLQSARCRALRKALTPLVEAQVQKMYGGEATKDEYVQKQEQKKARAFARNQAKVADSTWLKKTMLRAGRINRLEVLAKDQPELEGIPLVLDGAVSTEPSGLLEESNASKEEEEAKEEEGKTELNQAMQCYTCKVRFKEIHFFYDKLCPSCASFNWEKRHASCDMTGRVALVTGARVKIGFQTALKLLRAGATVIGTSRFSCDAATRFAAENDFAVWRERLFLYALDFRDLVALEGFCEHLLGTFPRLDVIINNACQTVRRPAAFYAHLLDGERAGAIGSGGLGTDAGHVLRLDQARRSSANSDAGPGLIASSSASQPCPGQGQGQGQGQGLASRMAAAEMSQLVMLPEDATSSQLLPANLYDVNHQQIDLRSSNSWLLKLHEVSTPELAEVFAINALAPYVLVARLKPMLQLTSQAERNRLSGSSSTSSSSSPMGADEGAGAQAAGGMSSLAASIIGGTDGGQKGRTHRDSRHDNYQGTTSADAKAVRMHHKCATFVVNVSSMEGKFYRRKLSTHPHTNMAKAALNMMTRTSAAEFIRDGIAMTAVDTGWINDENPMEKAARAAARHGFTTPLDEIDAAARILDPVFAPLFQGQGHPEGMCVPPFGCFLKDYHVNEW